MSTPTRTPGSELYPTWPATDFTHYSAAELNDFHDTDGFDVTLPASGDQTRVAA